MKKMLVLAFSLAVVATSMPALVGADADTGDKPQKKRARLTEEQRKVRKEILEKYDTNKDGKLDKEERSKMSKEDREKMSQAGLGKKRKPAEDAPKKDSSK